MENFEEKLIEYVRAHEILYNKKSSGYRNCSAKARLWNEISENLGSTVEECIRRWKSLRDRYSRELKRSEQPSGSGASNTQKWQLFDIMDFLRVHVAPRQTRDNLMNIPILMEDGKLLDEVSIDDNILDIRSPSPATSISSILNSPCTSPGISDTQNIVNIASGGLTTSNRKKKFALEDVNRSFMEGMTSIKNYIENGVRTVTEDDKFGQTVANLISPLTPANKKKAKTDILRLLLDFQTEELD